MRGVIRRRQPARTRPDEAHRRELDLRAPAGLRPAHRPALVEFMTRMIGETPVDVVAEFFPTLTSHDKLTALGVLSNLPVVIVCGADDLVTPVRPQSGDGRSAAHARSSYSCPTPAIRCSWNDPTVNPPLLRLVGDALTGPGRRMIVLSTAGGHTRLRAPAGDDPPRRRPDRSRRTARCRQDHARAGHRRRPARAGRIASPTFVIARVHSGLVPLVHVDAYRLGSLEEVDDLDLDVSADDAVTVVEWGEGKAEQLAESYLTIVLGRVRRHRGTHRDAGCARRRLGDAHRRSGPDVTWTIVLVLAFDTSSAAVSVDLVDVSDLRTTPLPDGRDRTGTANSSRPPSPGVLPKPASRSARSTRSSSAPGPGRSPGSASVW